MDIISVPGTRIDGIDKYAVSRTAESIVKALADAQWTVGEVELLPRYLEDCIKKSQKRRYDSQPFLADILGHV